MNIAHWLARRARLTPDAPALIAGDAVEADYAGFAARAGSIAGGLGVRPGDRVGIFMKNRTAYLEALMGVLWAGAAAVPVNAKLLGREAAWILENAGASVALVSDDVAQGLAETAPGLRLISTDGAEWARLRAGDPVPVAERGAEDLAWLFYTSGTTGRPKGVMLPHRALMAQALCYLSDVEAVEAQDATLYAAPMSHGAGLYSFVHVLRGARHVAPPSGGFDAAEVLDLAPRLGRVQMFAAPTMVRRLVDAAKTRGLDGEGLRTVVYGGGPMYVADIQEAVQVLGPRFAQIYGQGESPMCITATTKAQVADRSHPRWRERLGSVGTAQACAEVAVGTPEAPLGPGEDGEVLVRGPQLMSGYWRNEGATAETLAGGWLRTGDVGRLDEDGFLTLTDRSKDVIISGGTNIYPREVEEALLTHPSVHEVSVLGRPHPEWGEEVVAFVALAPGAAWAPEALDAHCRAHIARFKRPKDWVRVEELPKNAYGKILKTELRDRLKAMREG